MKPARASAQQLTPALAALSRAAAAAPPHSHSSLTDMEDGHGQLDVAKVPGADLDVLLAGSAGEGTVDGAQLGVVETLRARQLLLLVHGLGVDDVDHAHGLDLLGREQAEL